MIRETLLLAALQSSVLFLAVWIVLQLVPSIPANAKAWIWRLAFLKPLMALLPFAVVTLHVLPAATPEVPYSATGLTNDIVFIGTGTAPIQKSSIDPLLAIWFMGAIGVGLQGLFAWARVVRIVKEASPVTDSELLRHLDLLQKNAGIKRPIRLLSSPDAYTAMLASGFRPTLVLPQYVLEQESNLDARLMLAHEIAHIARRDVVWFAMTWVVQSVFFFNPVVWLAVRSSRLDHESATDQLASELAGVPIQTYAEMLLRATVVARTSIAPGVLPMSESFRTIHRRLEAMKHFQSKPSFWRKSAIVALALATVGLLPAYQLAQAASSDKEQKVVASKDQGATATIKSADSAVRATSAKRTDGRVAVQAKSADTTTVRATKTRDGAIATRPTQIRDRAIATRPASKAVGGQVQVRDSAIALPIQSTGGTIKARPIPRENTVLPQTAPSGDTNPLLYVQGGTIAPTQIRSEANPVSTQSRLPSPTTDSGVAMQADSKPISTGTVAANSTDGIATATFPQERKANANPFNAQADGRYATLPESSINIDPTTEPGSRSKSSMTIKLDNYDVRLALKEILSKARKNYIIKPEVTGIITMSVDNVPFETGLEVLLKAVNCKCRIERGIYIIESFKK